MKISKNVNTIGEYAFYDCNGLNEITISKGVTSIGNGAFGNCRFINIWIPESVTFIGENAFEGCDKLANIIIDGDNNPNYCSADGILYSKDKTKLICVPGGRPVDGRYEISNTVTSIGNYAFASCSLLKNITIPDSVKTIGKRAFVYCESLKSVEIGTGVKSIGEQAFEQCSLKEVKIKDMSMWCDIDFGCEVSYSSNPLYNAEKLYLNGEEVTDLVIPEEVTKIKAIAFANFDGFESVTIPTSLTVIGDDAFRLCTGLKKVNITDVGAWCNIDFENMYANPLYNTENLYLNGEEVTELIIPDGVLRIKAFAFENCKNITSVVIPDSVVSVHGRAFYGCKGLNGGKVYYTGTEEEWKKITFVDGNSSLLNALLVYLVYVTHEIIPFGIEDGNVIIVAFYNGNKMVELKTAEYEGEPLKFTVKRNYTSAKAMIWDSLDSMKPVGSAMNLK